MNFPPSRLNDRAAELRRAFDRSFAERARADAAPTEDFLAIRIASDSYAIRCSEISGLVADKKITRVPSGSAALHGMARISRRHHAGLQPRCIARPSESGDAAVDRHRSDLPVALGFEAFEGNLRISRDAILPREAR